MFKYKLPIDTRIKNNLICPVCNNKMNYNNVHSVYCNCGYAKGQLDHLHFISRNILVGNVIASTDQELIDLLGINSILTVACDFNQEHASVENYYRVDLHDSSNNTRDEFMESVNKLREWSHDKTKRILVHCMGGARRSVAVASFCLSAKKYWNARRAIKIAKDFKKVRPVVNVSGGIFDWIDIVYVKGINYNCTCPQCRRK